MMKKLMKVALVSAALVVGLAWFFFWSVIGVVQDAAVGSAEVVATELAPSLYRLDVVLGERQAGGALVASIGPDGVLLVDATGSAVLAGKVAEALRGLGADGVDLVVATHAHPDHVRGTQWFAERGATVVGHARTAHWMSVPVKPFWFARAVPPAPEAARPSRLIETEETLRFNGQTVRLLPVDAAHTDGDLVVSFVEAGIAHVGDLFNGRGRYSTASWVNGGEVDGLVRALARLDRVLPDGTRLVGGHSPVGSTATMAELGRYRELLAAVVAEVESGLRQGEEPEAIAEAMAPVDDDWFAGDDTGTRHGDPAGLVRNVAGSIQRRSENVAAAPGH